MDLGADLWGNYIDELISMCRGTDGDGTPEDYYYHCDDLYNVTALSDSSGNPVEHYEYDVYGTPFVFDSNGNQLSSGSAYANPYMFTGRRFDLESRFYYYRTRYYEPAIGRFTTRDTIGIWGDPLNLGNASNYVASNPWRWGDPFGEQCPCEYDGVCHDTYRKRLAKALNDYTNCMADKAPPVSIWNVACVIGCAPALSGTPALYLACVLACNGVVTATAIAEIAVCDATLEADRENAKHSYCHCLQQQQKQCPRNAEVDIVGCP